MLRCWGYARNIQTFQTRYAFFLTVYSILFKSIIPAFSVPEAIHCKGSSVSYSQTISTGEIMRWYHQVSSDHLSTRHEGDWGAVEACHDTVCLLAGVFLCIESWGKKHTVKLDVEFFDEAGESVGYPVCIRIWTPILGKMRSNAHWAGRGNLAVATRSIGLRVSVTATGRQAQA
jgi:hypothetical protein